MSTSAWIEAERKEGLRDRARADKVMIDGQGDVAVVFKPTRYIDAELAA